MTLKKYKPYLLSIAIPLVIGGVSAFITMKGMPYYDMQRKPFFTPPNAVFPIVWTILYILMGISAARVWQSNDPKKKQALHSLIAGLVIFLALYIFTNIYTNKLLNFNSNISM